MVPFQSLTPLSSSSVNTFISLCVSAVIDNLSFLGSYDTLKTTVPDAVLSACCTASVRVSGV